MNDAALFVATVPVFLYYLRRIDFLLLGLPDDAEVLLQKILSIHAFSAAEHLQTAIGFPARTVCPLLGRVVKDVEHEDCSLRS